MHKSREYHIAYPYQYNNNKALILLNFKSIAQPLNIERFILNFAWIIYLYGRTNLRGATVNFLLFEILDHPNIYIYMNDKKW